MVYYDIYFMFYIVNIDQYEMKLVLVNISQQEKQISIEEIELH